jgi:thiol-disulfide isomerase/thioredoxin
MKNRVVFFTAICCILMNCLAFGKSQAQGTKAGSYQLTVNVNGYKGEYIYLGYHYGKIKALADSAQVQGTGTTGTANFKGSKPLPGGIYFVVSPKKEILFELLVDKEQQFTMTVDTSKTADIQFKGSKDNTDFQTYTRYIQSRGAGIAHAQKELATASKADSARIQQKIKDLNAEIFRYRADYMKNSPGSFLSSLFAALSEPQVPPASAQPGGVYDSSFAYRYFKGHYWDGISFSDERLLRTPFFESRVDRYFRDLVSPEPDSVKKEIDQFLLKARNNREMYKFLLTHFVTQYINPQYMGQDAVFVHLFEKYINEKPEVDWFTEKYKKYMTDRAYSLMANLIGNPAWDMVMTDTSGRLQPLYEVSAPFVVICFWDPTCSHCKEMVPHLDSMYQKKWKQQGIKIYGVMTEGGKDNWLKYIRENNLKDWIHVYQTETQRETERNSGKPGYRQLYDVYQTPVLYLLDEQKRIVAKKLTYQQIDDLISIKQQKK